MTKFVILGSCRFAPYEILVVPEPIPTLHNTEEGYKIASQKFYPAIDQADVIIVYAPDGIGEHTHRDIKYAQQKGKRVFMLHPLMTKHDPSQLPFWDGKSNPSFLDSYSDYVREDEERKRKDES